MSGYHRPHILIVSDDQNLSQFLQEGLVVAGFWISVVASSLQTLELFRLRTFDLMLVDIMLEGMGADELVQRLRAQDASNSVPRTDIPILALAGDVRELTGIDLESIAADAMILPPIEIEEIALDIYARIGEWRAAHPERPWADELAQKRD